METPLHECHVYFTFSSEIHKREKKQEKKEEKKEEEQ